MDFFLLHYELAQMLNFLLHLAHRRGECLPSGCFNFRSPRAQCSGAKEVNVCSERVVSTFLVQKHIVAELQEIYQFSERVVSTFLV